MQMCKRVQGKHLFFKHYWKCRCCMSLNLLFPTVELLFCNVECLADHINHVVLRLFEKEITVMLKRGRASVCVSCMCACVCCLWTCSYILSVFYVFVCMSQGLHVCLFRHVRESAHVLRVRVCFSPWLVAVGRISDRTRCSVKALS